MNKEIFSIKPYTSKMKINNMVNDLRDGIIQVKIGRDTDRAGIEAIKKLVSITFPEDSTHIFDDEEKPFKYRRSKYIYLSKYRWGLWKIQNRKDKRLDVVSSSKVVDLFTQDSAKV